MIRGLARAMRIENDYLRVVVLTALFLPELLIYTIDALQHHPNKKRLLSLGFYLAPLDLFLAGMRGEFVGLPYSEPERP